MGQNNKTKLRRDWKLDLVRCIAIFEVVSVHFLLNSGFYNEPVAGPLMVAEIYIRAIAITCVPLFMILTGYLFHGEPTKRYYSKIVPVLLSYVIASIACLAYVALKNHETIAVAEAIKQILGFHADPYSWYVEMHIGLFLLAPFLNILWNALDKTKKTALLFTAFFVSFLPNITNVYVIDSIDWWFNPSSSPNYNPILPAWWMGLYPVGYFFAGRWLAEFGLPLKRPATILLLLTSIAILALFDFWRSHNVCYIWGAWNSYGSPLVAAIAILLFWLCMLFKKPRPRIAPILAFVSKASFGAYLLSWIWDQSFYPILAAIEPSIQMRVLWFPAIVVAVFVCSILSSWLMGLLVRLILNAYRHIKNRLRRQQ